LQLNTFYYIKKLMFKEIYNQVCMMKFNKSLLLISIGLIITSTQAVLAEDAMSKSTFDWTGVYVGGFVGGATGANVTNKATNSPKLFGVIPQGSSSTSANSSTSGTFMGGGTVGYNWQIPKTPYLIGLEGEYGYLGSSGSSQSQSVGPLGLVSLNTQNKTTIGSDYGYGLVGGRLGYALDRSLFYVKSGAVFTQVNSTNSTNTSIAGSPFNTAGSSNSGGTTTGYAIGGGLNSLHLGMETKTLRSRLNTCILGYQQHPILVRIHLANHFLPILLCLYILKTAVTKTQQAASLPPRLVLIINSNLYVDCHFC
jgi:outer membrane immunogenic protein